MPTPDDDDKAFDDLLRDRLPKYDAPRSLRASLKARHLEDKHPEPRDSRAPNDISNRVTSRRSYILKTYVTPIAVIVAAVAAIVLVAAHFQADKTLPLVNEALNDHLRILYSDHPVEIASGGIHQVKPWFEGKVDFAPVEPFAGDADFPLEGGSIAYFIDRKAAAFVFKKRLHVISLFVFRADGINFPSGDDVTSTDVRGFHVLVWKRADLGYALVSDVDPNDLNALSAKIRAGH